MARKVIDWEAVEIQYQAGVRSLKDIGVEFGVSDAGIIKRAKNEGWTRGLAENKKGKFVLGKTVDEYDRSGYVYVIYLDAPDRYYKIGMASRFDSRFSQHQCASPFDLCVAIAYFVGNMRAEESFLHNLFSEKRVRGEWFRLSADDLKYVAARALLV
jgi:hypothetical protein